MKILVNEKLSEHKLKTPEGYLICTDAILARTGKQEYLKKELFGDSCEDSDEMIEVERPYDEVFSKATLASFENKPVCIEHPNEDVNIDNYKDYAVGYARNIRQDKIDGVDVIIADLVITDKDAIELIESGKMTDLSCGYDCEIIQDDKGEYMQSKIRGNHIALCEEGRAGNARIVDSNINDKKYQFPELTKEDLEKAKKYNLKIVKKLPDGDIILEGSLYNLKKYADDWLDYELVKGYLSDSKVEDSNPISNDKLLKKINTKFTINEAVNLIKLIKSLNKDE